MSTDGAAASMLDELELCCRIERDVEQQQRKTRQRVGTPGQRHGGRRTEGVARSVADADSNSRSNRSSSTARSAPPSGEAVKVGGCNLRQSEFAKRSRQGPRKAGRSRNRPEIGECVVTDRLERGPGSDCFRAKIACRRSRDRPRGLEPQAARASCVRLKRCRPTVAPSRDRDRPCQVVGRSLATRRQAEGCMCRDECDKARASARRSSLEADSTRESWRLLPGRCAGSPGTTAPRDRERKNTKLLVVSAFAATADQR